MLISSIDTFSGSDSASNFIASNNKHMKKVLNTLKKVLNILKKVSNTLKYIAYLSNSLNKYTQWPAYSNIYNLLTSGCLTKLTLVQEVFQSTIQNKNTVAD